MHTLLLLLLLSILQTPSVAQRQSVYLCAIGKPQVQLALVLSLYKGQSTRGFLHDISFISIIIELSYFIIHYVRLDK